LKKKKLHASDRKQVNQLKYKLKYITDVKHLSFGIHPSAESCFKQGLFVGAALHADSLQWPFKLAGAHIFI